MRTTFLLPAGKPLPWITPKLLRTIAPTLSQPKAEVYAEAFARLCPQFGMDTPTEFEEFIANVLHETDSLGQLVENCNYSKHGLADTWPSRYAIKTASGKGYEREMVQGKMRNKPNALAVKLARKPEAIANNAYANRMGNGNEASGDGYRYRGGGGIMSTGKSMYEKGAAYFGIPVAEYANLIQTQPEWVVLSALFIFCIEKGLLDEATRNEAKTICIRINGALIGWDDREVFRKRAARALGL